MTRATSIQTAACLGGHVGYQAAARLAAQQPLLVQLLRHQQRACGAVRSSLIWQGYGAHAASGAASATSSAAASGAAKWPRFCCINPGPHVKHSTVLLPPSPTQLAVKHSSMSCAVTSPSSFQPSVTPALFTSSCRVSQELAGGVDQMQPETTQAAGRRSARFNVCSAAAAAPLPLLLHSCWHELHSW